MKRQLLKNEKYRIFFATFCALGWSLAYPLIKLGYQSFGIVSNDLGSKFLFAGLRFLFAGIALLLTSNRLKKSWHIQDRGKLLLFALVNITFHYMFAYIGLGFNPGSRSTILDSLSGFLLIVMAGWVDHNDSFSKQKLVGILLGITGILFINLSPNQNYFENITFWGDGMLILNALFGAWGGLLTRQISKHMDMMVATGFSMAIGGAILIGFTSIVHPSSAWHISWLGILILCGLISISAICFGIYNQLLTYHPISKVAIFNALIPVLGVCFSALLLNEPLKPQYIVSVLLVGAGIYSINHQS